MAAGDRSQRSFAALVLNIPLPTWARLPLIDTALSVVRPSLNSPPPTMARLPRIMTLVSTSLPPSFRSPPPRSALPLAIVTPERESDPPSTSKTPLLPPPPIVSRLAPGPTIVMVRGSERTSGPPVSRIV